MRETRPLIRGLLLPLPPTANAYWDTRIIFSKEQQRHMAIPYTTHAAKAYKEDIKERMMDLHCRFYSKAPLEMTMVVCPRDARRQDISNRLKSFEDAIKDAKVFVDDCQIVSHHLLRGPIIKQGRVMLFLSEVEILEDEILSRGLGVKYIAGGLEAYLPDQAAPQSGELFQDEVRNEVGVRRSTRRGVSSGRARRSGGTPQASES